MAIFFYGCVTMDGYLADNNHRIDWLHDIGSVEETSYADFFAQIDLLIMGRKTYDEIKDMEQLEDFYGQTRNIVFTHQEEALHPLFEKASGDILEFVESIPTDQNIWIVGGNSLVAPLLDANKFDKIYLQIAPVLLGAGVPLFTQKEGLKKFHLIETKQYGQFAELVLEKTKEN